ncbi:LysR family transcriptional regulator [Pseudomonas syringae]|uniref:LysR family transcriptional regulator n=1 Tax=Pseudomonas syringae TaxID=317 RepID=UPI0009B5F38B|nr:MULTISPECIES: LysR family transcriptional regulator [Pseudomonas syringae group]RMM10879.1 hypothetical protein ALQ85_200122 [Pseudomonas syringae]
MRLDLSSSTLSQAIRLLEKRLETKLLNCTPRSGSPTAAGQHLLTRLHPVLNLKGVNAGAKNLQLRKGGGEVQTSDWFLSVSVFYSESVSSA